MKTLAASGIGDFRYILKWNQYNSPAEAQRVARGCRRGGGLPAERPVQRRVGRDSPCRLRVQHCRHEGGGRTRHIRRLNGGGGGGQQLRVGLPIFHLGREPRSRNRVHGGRNPPGIPLDETDIQHHLDRRRPGQSRFTTQRREPDMVRILSGVFEGRTTGTPIGMLIENTDQRTRDYGEIRDRFRPGHADYTYEAKYGIRDYRGGGRSSARETAMRVAAGAVARKVLSHRLGGGITVRGALVQVGPHAIDRSAGSGRRRPQPVLVPGSRDGGPLERFPRLGAQAGFFGGGGDRGGCRWRARRPRRAGLRQARQRPSRPR